MTPLISIILPTKNPGRFLKERLDSIFAQTLSDWEMIIVDSESTDGSLPILQNLADTDPRISFFEQPPGLYQAWNFGIRKARGKYVYVATADDTMTADALQKMSDALENHPECDLCDSLLKLIDENGQEIPEFADSYVAHCWHFAYPRTQMHIRQSPADFFAHLGGKTIYTSVTQLLIRRSLLEKTGLFPENFGSSADYMWGMLAALHGNVIFLPEYLSAWRIHKSQATFASDPEKTLKNYFLMIRMAQEILRKTPQDINHAGRKLMRLATFKGILLPAKKKNVSPMQKLGFLCKALFCTPLQTSEFLLTLPLYLWRIPYHFVFIYTYDKMIRRHTKRFYSGKIMNIHTEGEKDAAEAQAQDD